MNAGRRDLGTERSNTWVTLPNIICVLRMLASPVLVVLAARDERLALVSLFMALTLSDWVDGKLAILLDQRSRLGPYLDSFADLAMYASLLTAMVWIDGDRLLGELPWILVGAASWAAMVAFSFAKFRRWPSVHTRSAKFTWGLAAIGVVTFLGGWAVWPLRLAFASGTLANLHALAILRVLPFWQADVPTLKAARAVRDRPIEGG